MKKIILCVVVAILAVIIAFASISGIKYFKNRENTSNENVDSEQSEDNPEVKTFVDELFYVKNMSELKTVTSDLKLEIVTQDDDDRVYVENVDVNGITMQFCYFIDEDENFSQMKAFFVPFYDDFKKLEKKDSKLPTHKGSELKKEIEKIFKCFDSITGATIGDNFYIISDDKLLDNTKDSSYDDILNGKAKVHFSLRFGDDTYMCIYSNMPEDYVCFECLRYFNPEMYADSITNIDIG